MERRYCINEIIHTTKAILMNRPKNIRIDNFLEIIFKKYNSMLLLVNCDDISSIIEEVSFVEQRILESINDYFNGRLMGALVEIQRLNDNIGKKLKVTTLKEGEIWYRGRIKEQSVGLYEKNEMFHIPDSMRERVSNQRFSFNGYPCLYLGKSIWDCWEELDEPQLENVCFSALKITKELCLLDLSMPSEKCIYSDNCNEVVELLITFPLILACSIKVQDEKANFKSEYIIPQLLMNNLINYHKFDGYLFSSTKQNTLLEWDDNYLNNVVLPVNGDFDNSGLSNKLKQCVSMTEPICYKYEFLKSTVSNLSSFTEKYIDNLLSDKGWDKTRDLYSKSLFGQMEMVLKRKEFTQI